MAKLTPKQQKFVEEYIIHLEAKKAALNAGYSPKTAEQQGYQLLQHPSVKAEIAKRQRKAAKKYELTEEWIIEQLMKRASYNVTDFAEIVTERVPVKRDDGSIVEVERQYVKYNENFDGNVVDGLSKGKDGIKFEFPNRDKALELLGKRLGMWTDKVEANVTGAMTVVFDKSMEEDDE